MYKKTGLYDINLKVKRKRVLILSTSLCVCTLSGLYSTALDIYCVVEVDYGYENKLLMPFMYVTLAQLARVAGMCNVFDLKFPRSIPGGGDFLSCISLKLYFFFLVSSGYVLFLQNG